MKISYLVTVHNEDASLKKCLNTIGSYKDDADEIVILDDFSDNPKTKEVINQTVSEKDINHIKNARVYLHALDRNYGAHKNWGNEQCSGDWVFQIDGDEIPAPTLIANIKPIIEANNEVELIFVPRINDFIGVTHEHARKWGWRLTPCSVCDNRFVVNWPDYQGRIYKRDPDRIRWDRRLHEKLEGHTSMATLPADYDLSLYHDKTIDTQEKTNIRYNTWFTEEENKGHDVFSPKK